QLDRNRDDEHHEQHEHHVDQRRRVDVHDRLMIAASGTYIHCHEYVLALAATWGRPGEEPDLGDSGTVAGVDDPPDRIVLGAAITPDLHFRLRLKHRDLL